MEKMFEATNQTFDTWEEQPLALARAFCSAFVIHHGQKKIHQEKLGALGMKSWGTYIQLVWLSFYPWKFQDPKMEVLYYIRPYFVGISPYIGLTNRPYIW